MPRTSTPPAWNGNQSSSRPVPSPRRPLTRAWLAPCILAFLWTAALLGLLRPSPAQAQLAPPPLVINEIHADPAPNAAGDANGDGLRDPEQDEFVELVNVSGGPLDLSGWRLQDEVGDRHIFPPGTLLADGCALVVFGGGAPTGAFGGSLVQTATTGLLGLNNGGDRVTILDSNAVTVTTVSFGPEGGNDQSLTRFPDSTGPEPLVLHSVISQANGALFSPGLRVEGYGFDGCATELSIQATATVTSQVGQVIAYTLTARNGLTLPLTSLVISDRVPLRTVLARAEDGGQASGLLPGSRVSWTVPSLSPGGEVQVHFQVTVAGTLSQVVNGAYGLAAGNVPATASGPPVTTAVTGALSIHQIQGAGHFSAWDDQAVGPVPGVVTAVRSNGFYLQEPDPDGAVATAEGVFVYWPDVAGLQPGDLVLVDATVNEFYPGGRERGGLSVTELVSPTVQRLASGHPLPQPVLLGQGGRPLPNQVIDDDASGDVETTGSFDPETDGIDFFESLEGMLVQVNRARVVGPTRFGEFQVVADNGEEATVLSSRGSLVIREGDFNPERLFIDDALVSSEPDVNVGDAFTQPITGVVDYGFGNFKIFNTTPLPPVVPGSLLSETTSLTGTENRLTVATFNLENLAPEDGPEKFQGLAQQIVHNLGAPDILAVQEVQDNNGSVNDDLVDASTTYSMLLTAIQEAGGPVYDYREIPPEDGKDGGQPGGNIRVALLFRPGRVTFVDRGSAGPTDAITVTQTLTGPVLSASPGRIDPTNSAFSRSRKPLAGEFLFQGQRLFVIVVHFNSKGGDDPLFGRVQPPEFSSENKRREQARVVHDFVAAILALDPQANVVVLGDMNEHYFASPVQELQGGILTNLIERLPVEERYTFLYQGNAQVLDNLLVSASLASLRQPEADIVHVNAEFHGKTAHRWTDHDPVLARFYFGELSLLYLPLVQR